MKTLLGTVFLVDSYFCFRISKCSSIVFLHKGSLLQLLFYSDSDWFSSKCNLVFSLCLFLNSFLVFVVGELENDTPGWSPFQVESILGCLSFLGLGCPYEPRVLEILFYDFIEYLLQSCLFPILLEDLYIRLLTFWWHCWFLIQFSWLCSGFLPDA